MVAELFYEFTYLIIQGEKTAKGILSGVYPYITLTLTFVFAMEITEKDKEKEKEVIKYPFQFQVLRKLP